MHPVALSQSVEHLQLLPGHVDRLVHQDPGGRLPAAGERGAALVRDVVRRARQDVGQGEVVDSRVLTAVLDVLQFGGDQSETLVSFPSSAPARPFSLKK